MPAERKLRVFLCHASQDKPAVRGLYKRLAAEPWIDPWLDEEKLLPGQDWNFEIEKAVEASDAVIVCLSGKSVSKDGYVQKELRFVLNIADEKPEGTIFVIPLRLDNCVLPRRLKIWHYLDFFPVDRQDWAFTRLLDSFKVRSTIFQNDVSQSNSVSLDITDAVQTPQAEKPFGPGDNSQLELVKILDSKFGFDDFWSLCDEVEQKMRQGGLTEYFSLGAFGDGRPKHDLIYDVVTFLSSHNSLHYLKETIKNKYPRLINDEDFD